MVRAWYMDVEGKPEVSLAQLEKLGILYWKIDADRWEEEGVLPKIRLDRGYKNFDVVVINRDKMGDQFDAKLKIFFTEHLHDDEEIRLLLDGSGFFDVRDVEDKWIRIHVVKNDMIILPAGIFHRFTVDENEYTHAMRLFTEEPKWTPINRDREAEKKAAHAAWRATVGAPPAAAAADTATESRNGTPYVLVEGAKSIANYPHMRRAGPFLYVSGISSRRPDNTHIGATRNADGTWTLDIKEQTRAVIENIRTILRLAGADLDCIVDATVFLVDMAHYADMNAVYNEFFQPATGPTRTTVAVHQLPHPNLLVEIKVVALAPPAGNAPTAAATASTA